MKRFYVISALVAVTLLLAACGGETQTVEVTRVIQQEIQVPVEVTRVVAEVVTVEVPSQVEVEVTRVVEIVVTPTPDPNAETAVSAPTAELPTPTASDTAVTDTAVTTETVPTGGSTYTVQSGDNISIISVLTGVPAETILAANNLTSNLLITGQELFVPGWDGVLAEVPVGTAPEAPTTNTPATDAPVTLAPVGGNLLADGSFEGDWYFFNGVQEWQITQGWSLAIDEGPNTLTPEDGDLFLRPEVRVVSRANLPAEEHASFVFDGDKTVKIFKGGAPTSFAVFTDLALPPGTYRFTVNFFPDVVSTYNGGQKVWATTPQAAEVRFIQNSGGSDWINVTPGIKNTLTYDFTVEEGGNVRLGAAFRNRFVNSNNGWFIDDWKLERLEATQ